MRDFLMRLLGLELAFPSFSEADRFSKLKNLKAFYGKYGYRSRSFSDSKSPIQEGDPGDI